MSLVDHVTIPRIEGADHSARSARALAASLQLDVRGRRLTIGEASVDLPTTAPSAVALLTTWLYGVVHVGNPQAFATEAVLADADFEQLLRATVPDPGLRVPVRPVADRPGLVELHRVRLTVASSTGSMTASAPGSGPARAGSLPSLPSLVIPSHRPRLSPGFYMLVADTPDSGATGAPELVRYYSPQQDPATAVAVWAQIVEQLRAHGGPFRTKILSRRRAYPRRDAIVVYAPADDDIPGLLAPVLAAHDVTDLPGSPLCAPATPGLFVADEPMDPRPGQHRRSFGEHRCTAIAEAVMAVLDSAGSVDLAAALTEACVVANIDPDDVSRNLQRPGGEVR